jgi:hypothetical protein
VTIVRTVCMVVALLLSAACANHGANIRAAQVLVSKTQSKDNNCARDDRCASVSAIRADADVRTRDGGHGAILLNDAEAALVARVHLIRAARHSIDLQTFIFADDDVGVLLLGELLAAARRGVRVRVLSDQLFSLDNRRFLARLAQEHANFDFRLYNPTFNEAKHGAAGIRRRHPLLLLPLQPAQPQQAAAGRRAASASSAGATSKSAISASATRTTTHDRDLLVYGDGRSKSMEASFDRILVASEDGAAGGAEGRRSSRIVEGGTRSAAARRRP